MGAFKFIALFSLLLGWTAVARALPLKAVVARALPLKAVVTRALPLKAAVTVEASREAFDCPQSAALLAAVESILERQLENVPVSEAPVKIEVRFSKDADEYRARLILRGKKSGERQLSDSSPDCAPLAEAASVTMALFFDQEFPAEDAFPELSPVDKALVSEGSLPENLQSSRDLSVRVQVLAGVAFGLGPKISPLFGVGVNASFKRLLVGGGFQGTLPTSVALAPGEVKENLLFASLHACLEWGDNWVIAPCAFFGVGGMRAQGEGYREEASESLWWTALGPALVFRGALGARDRLFWGATGVLWIPTQSQVLTVDHVGVAWQSPALQGTLSLNLGVRVW